MNRFGNADFGAGAFRAGVGRAIISPETGIYLIGFADRTGGAESVHDDLTATTLVVDDGREKALIIALDLLLLHPETATRVKEGITGRLGIPGRNILLCCSHTHSGPVAWAPSEITLSERLREIKNRILAFPAGFMQMKANYEALAGTANLRGEKAAFLKRMGRILKTIALAPKAFAQPKGIRANRKYLDRLVETLVDSAASASRVMEACVVTHARGKTDIGINRRERKADGKIDLGYYREGPVDPEVDVLQFSRGGKAFLTLVNHACHATILGPNTNVVSADMIGVMRARVEKELGGLCMFLQGACGDINPNVGWSDENIPNAKRFGERLAHAVLEIAKDMKSVSPTPIRGLEDIVDASLEVPERLKDRPEQKIYQQMIHRNLGVPLFLIEPVLSIRFPWKAPIEKTPDGYSTPVHVGALRMGDVSIAWASMEVFVDIGRAVKKASSAPVTLFAGYTNGHNGYLPTAEEGKLGGYEVERAPYMLRMPGIYRADTEAKVVTSLVSLLGETALQKE